LLLSTWHILGAKQVQDVEDKTLLFLVVAVSLAFGWVLWPFYGAILWAIILAILFEPLYRRMLRSMPRWPSLAALATVVIIVVMVLVPLGVIANLVIQEAIAVHQRLQSGELTFAADFDRIREMLPVWMTNLLGRLGLESFAALREKLWAALMESGDLLAGQAINIGQTTLNFVLSLFVMLYLLFFLLNHGKGLSASIVDAIPLRAGLLQTIASKSTVAIRAILKGTLLVALVQGALGGLILWLLGFNAPVLWGGLMAVFSLLPIWGTALVWVPAAVYLLVTGAIWQGIVLFAFGVLVISMVDNILRPILIGHDTKIPDSLVLISTLGGIVMFGANGFVIGPVIAAIFIAVWTVFSASNPRLNDGSSN
jgi:predicted PurR-regulated permease PerM